MVICPECQKEEMVAIGTQKFEWEGRLDGSSNWWTQMVSKEYDKTWKLYVVTYCKKCNVIHLQEPKMIFG